MRIAREYMHMKIVSFFAGCGGLDLGFEQAGFDVVWANEVEPYYRATYIRNHPGTELVLGDICKIDPNSIPDCDGFIGGPPCQSWSVAGKQRGLEDERGQLFLKYIDMIEAKRPKFFVIENVKGLLDSVFKYVFIMFLDRLDKAGYDVKWDLLDAANYRIPQNRERVFIVGFRKELHIDYKFPAPTCTEPITLERAIGDIKEQPTFYRGNERLEPNVSRPNHDVLASKLNVYYNRGNRRRGWQQTSFTIHATADNIPLHPSSPKMMFFGHGRWDFQEGKMNQYRRLSVRECARIQSFPDSFIFEGTDIKAQYKMIGNAVPPRLGNVLAKSILAALANQQPSEVIGIPATPVQPTISDACVLVGYCKGENHKRLILGNGLYYVRSDGRKGSLFKEDCSIIPKYLLLHHKDDAEFYELDGEEPILADASFLESLGFDVSGKTYLCFRLEDKKSIDLGTPVYDKRSFAPLFTTLAKVIKQ